jgi:hypothetical protein
LSRERNTKKAFIGFNIPDSFFASKKKKKFLLRAKNYYQDRSIWVSKYPEFYTDFKYSMEEYFRKNVSK